MKSKQVIEAKYKSNKELKERERLMTSGLAKTSRVFDVLDKWVSGRWREHWPV